MYANLTAANVAADNLTIARALVATDSGLSGACRVYRRDMGEVEVIAQNGDGTTRAARYVPTFLGQTGLGAVPGCVWLVDGRPVSEAVHAALRVIVSGDVTRVC